MIKDSISEMIQSGATRAEIMKAVEAEMKSVEERKAKVEKVERKEAHKKDVIAILEHLDNIMVREGVITEEERGAMLETPLVDIMVDTVLQAGKETRDFAKAMSVFPRGQREKIKSTDEDGSIDGAIADFLRTL